ncbi:MAG: MBL fold metallo-hydrolase [Syntrophomonadaceae bacterium]|jgi:glyoxylase-like metal-dependent hydrolase (beta-lactamase superfamily II)|nr:MBL fold metallo-hydrolase [Syntrophomonadaceae bacterium]
MKLLRDRVYFVEAPDKARFPYCHCLFIDDDARVIIDTSCGRQQALEISASGVDVILNSHFHEDHILNNLLFDKAQVWVHHLDAPPMVDMRMFFKYYGFIDPEGVELGQKFIDSLDLQPTPVHRKLRDGEILDFGHVRLKVIHTPGHTPGHCAFFQEETGFLFTGDIELSKFGPWYAHGCSNIDDFINSIQRCKDLQATMVVTSHKGIFTENIQQRFQDYMNIIFMKEEKIYNALREPQTLKQLAVKHLYYGSDVKMDIYMVYFEKWGVKLHLERMLEQKRIGREGELYFQR